MLQYGGNVKASMGTFGCNYLRNIRCGILGAHNFSVLRHY